MSLVADWGLVGAPLPVLRFALRAVGGLANALKRTGVMVTAAARANNDEDAGVVRKIALGDKTALSALYDRYSGLLLALGIRMMGVRSEAEDLLHDVFLEVWKRAGDYDPARGTVRAWLCLRMRSRALDRKKSPRMSRAVSFDDRAHETEAPHQDPGLRMERQRVRQALTALSQEQRDVVELCYFAGLSTAEAAEKLGCPVGTVKSRLSAARDRLRAALGDDGAGAERGAS